MSNPSPPGAPLRKRWILSKRSGVVKSMSLATASPARNGGGTVKTRHESPAAIAPTISGGPFRGNPRPCRPAGSEARIHRLVLRKFIAAGVPYEFGREVIAGWAALSCRGLPASQAASVLDVGCGEGADLLAVRQSLDPHPVRLCGLDSSAHHVRTLGAKGVETRLVDVEKDPFPFPDGAFDLVIANQVLEHAKEIFWILSEISRVLKKGGHLLVGVPNLAALHNRLFLLAGKQPVCLRNFGPHVRGFTAGDLRALLHANGVFTVLDVKGSHVHPFPPAVGRLLARAFPGLSTSVFLRARRNDVPHLFGALLESIRLETNFYRGPGVAP